MSHRGELRFDEEVKEPLVDALDAQLEQAGVQPVHARVNSIGRQGKQLSIKLSEQSDGANLELHSEHTLRAHNVVIAIGRSGDYRRLNIPGEELPKVSNRLHDAKEFAGKQVTVVGGCDSALETAIALTIAGADVTLSYRGAEFARAKPANVEKINELLANPSAPVGLEQPSLGRVTSALTQDMLDTPRSIGSLIIHYRTNITKIDPNSLTLRHDDGRVDTLENDFVFTMIGREAPLNFFRQSGIKVSGDWHGRTYLSLIFVLALFTFIYQWKKGGTWIPINEYFAQNQWFPFRVDDWWSNQFSDRSTLLGTLHLSVGQPGFWYSLAYTIAIGLFGYRRVKKRQTPYIKKQTWSLFLIQVVPLFLLPYLVLPYLGYQGFFDSGIAKSLADELFPAVNYGYGREYWRAFGFILAWPLFFWNVFTAQPLVGWLVISLVQTFVVIPWIVRRWGKGAYCGWICSCGALAETLGDDHRHKMPHGPKWNRLNMLGQFLLLLCMLMLVGRIVSWTWPNSLIGGYGQAIYAGILNGLPGLNYVWFVDLLFAGIIGVGLYFHFSGRVWCRFACPLAALMHIYARFSQFRIFAEKKKCISCNVCTSVCHMGIDIMSFANKGMPMEDPQCVRCSACVQSCPTGVLQFGRVSANGQIEYDKTPASLTRMVEALKKG